MHYETHIRSIFKTISWRFLATITTALLVFIFTKRITIAVMVGGIEAILKIIFYFLHERAWNKIKFGRKEISPFVLWFTGLPYSGKTTIADEVFNHLKKSKLRAERLDSKNVRALFPEVGFSRNEVNSHIKRVGHLASTLEDNGIIVIASFVSPYQESRQFAKGLCKNFIEVYTKASMDLCRQRHTDNISSRYKRQDFPEDVYRVYEEPLHCNIILDTQATNIEECKKKVLNYIKKYLNKQIKTTV